MSKTLDNLTRDVLAAEAAGFGPHYGDYIALFGHTSPADPPPKIEKQVKICGFCGKEFDNSNDLRRKYCGVVCRERARLKQISEAKARKKI